VGPFAQTDPLLRPSEGQANGRIGRVLLILGFAAAAGLDPWSLSERDPTALLGSVRMAMRQAQAVVVGMAFLQVIVAGALAVAELPARVSRPVVWLTGVGAILYAAGYVLLPLWPEVVWLIPAGALLNFAGFALLLARLGFPPYLPVWRVILPVICLGMLLDAAMGLFAAEPGRLLPAYLGPEDGVPLRMLRLARAAAIALPAVALLYEQLAASEKEPLARRGRALLWCGVATMSAVLALAAFTTPELKYLLPVPALTTFGGTCVAVLLAYRRASRLEAWGWLLVAASMGNGLLMGMYAFDGPMPAPPFLDGYNDFVRRLSRLGHAYCIVLGLLSVYVARLAGGDASGWRPGRVGIVCLVTGTVVTLVVIVGVAASLLTTPWLGLGPALVAVALLVCLGPAVVNRVSSGVVKP
jgi:hypothetical protein